MLLEEITYLVEEAAEAFVKAIALCMGLTIVTTAYKALHGLLAVLSPAH